MKRPVDEGHKNAGPQAPDDQRQGDSDAAAPAGAGRRSSNGRTSTAPAAQRAKPKDRPNSQPPLIRWRRGRRSARKQRRRSP